MFRMKGQAAHVTMLLAEIREVDVFAVQQSAPHSHDGFDPAFIVVDVRHLRRSRARC